MRRTYIDKPLALIVGILLIGGCLIFASAAFGLLGRGAGNITSIVANHLVLGVCLGVVLLSGATLFDYKNWRKFAPYFYALAIVATALVFIPHIGAAHGGGRRWIIIFGTSFQPSEVLKLACVVFSAAYCATIKGQIKTFTYGLGAFITILLLPALLLVLQPDIGTLGVMVFATFSVFWAAGIRFRDIFIILLIGMIAFGVLFVSKSYIRDRVETFFNPSQGAQEEGYQIRQSLIAIGSGGLFGRGFGQGIQKFTYLPEPMGDSIFAVAGEELGFAGTTILVALFCIFALRGYQIAARTTDPFGSYLATGISTYLVIEAFINIASMLGVAPLTGIPLTFISQGGSAILISLTSAGILLNISRKR
jgi:cell division protein FtsW